MACERDNAVASLDMCIHLFDMQSVAIVALNRWLDKPGELTEQFRTTTWDLLKNNPFWNMDDVKLRTTVVELKAHGPGILQHKLSKLKILEA